MDPTVPHSKTHQRKAVPAFLNDSRLVLALDELRDTAGQTLPLVEFLYGDPSRPSSLYQPIGIDVQNPELSQRISSNFRSRFTRETGVPEFDLTYLIETLDRLGKPGGIFLNARSGAGKSVAGVAAFADCFHGPGPQGNKSHKLPRLAGYLPVALSTAITLDDPPAEGNAKPLEHFKKLRERWAASVAGGESTARQTVLADVLKAALPDHFYQWLWKAIFAGTVGRPYQPERLKQWLDYGPPLLIVVDLNPAGELDRHIFAGALAQFQKDEPRHRAVVTYRTAMQDGVASFFAKSADFVACDLKPLGQPQARQYYEHFRRLKCIRTVGEADEAFEAALTADLQDLDVVLQRQRRQAGSILTVPLLMHFCSLLGAGRVKSLADPAELYEEVVNHFIDRDASGMTPQQRADFGQGSADDFRQDFHIAMSRLALGILAQGAGQTRLLGAGDTKPKDRLNWLWTNPHDPDLDGSELRWHPPDADANLWLAGPYYSEKHAFPETKCEPLRAFGLLHIGNEGVSFAHDSFIYFFAARAQVAFGSTRRNNNANKLSKLIDPEEGYEKATHPWYRAVADWWKQNPLVWPETAEFVGGMIGAPNSLALATELLVAEPEKWEGWPEVLRRLLRGAAKDNPAWRKYLDALQFGFIYEVGRIDNFPEGLLSYFYHLMRDLGFVREFGPKVVKHWLEPAIARRKPVWLRWQSMEAGHLGVIPWPDTLSFTGAKAGIICVKWLEDGSLAVGSVDGVFYCWEPWTGFTEILYEYGAAVNCMAINSKGRIALGKGDKVYFYDPTHPERRGADAPALIQHGDAVRAVAVNGRGQIASGSDDKTVRFYDPDYPDQSGADAPILILHGSSVIAVAVNERGQVASGSLDDTARFYDSAQPDLRGADVRTLTKNMNDIISVAVNEQGQVVSGSSDGKVFFYDPNQPELCGSDAEILIYPGGFIYGVATNNRGQVASTSSDTRVCLSDVSHPRRPRFDAPVVIQHGRSVTAVTVNERGQVASGSDDHTVRFYDPAHAMPITNPVVRQGGRVNAVAINEHGQVVTGGDGKSVDFYDPVHAELNFASKLIRHAAWVQSVAVNERGQIASGGWDDRVHFYVSAHLERTDVLVIIEHANTVTAVALNECGQVASASSDGVRFYDPAHPDKRGAYAPILIQLGNSVNALAVNERGQIASGNTDGEVRFYDPAHLERSGASALIQHQFTVHAVAVNGRGQVASGSDDHTVRYFDPAQPELRGAAAPLLIQDGSPIEAVSVNEQGQVASGSADGIVRFYDPAKPELRGADTPVFIRHLNAVFAVSVNEQEQVASGSRDSTIGYYDTRTSLLRRFLWWEHVNAVHIRDDGVIHFTSTAHPCPWKIRLVRGLDEPA